MAHWPNSNYHIKVTTTGKGEGLYASRVFVQGEAIFPYDYWSESLMPIHATNHSCDANGNFTDSGFLIAQRDIANGEEITFNYLQNPTPASPWNFACQCGTLHCVGWLKAEDKEGNDE